MGGAATKSKVVRFSDLVNQLGNPHTTTLWRAPEKDPAFLKAVKENRVLTVHQENRSQKSDVGSVGFHREKTAAYLIFPKSLEKFSEAKIVGIKYELIHEPPPDDPATVKEFTADHPPVGKYVKKDKSYKVIVEQTFKVKKTEVVDAPNKTEARKLALQKIHENQFEQKPPETEVVLAVEES